MNPTTLESAVAAFDPYKSPGFNRMYLTMLQIKSENTLSIPDRNLLIKSKNWKTVKSVN